MSTFKPFFIHRHHAPGHLPNRSPRGFTALISPAINTDQIGVNDRMVNMQVTFCSPKDQFVKKEGRRLAALAKIETLNKRDVPRMLAALSKVTHHNYGDEFDYK